MEKIADHGTIGPRKYLRSARKRVDKKEKKGGIKKRKKMRGKEKKKEGKRKRVKKNRLEKKFK